MSDMSPEWVIDLSLYSGFATWQVFKPYLSHVYEGLIVPPQDGCEEYMK